MKAVAIDLFCGIGGLSYGLKKAGIPVVAGVDLDNPSYTGNFLCIGVDSNIF